VHRGEDLWDDGLGLDEGDPAEGAWHFGSGRANSSCVVGRLAVGKASLLLAGDANGPEETWLLGRGLLLRSTVLN
jgi:beta-lactamase superfamily II metal-dependent hydrolase